MITPRYFVVSYLYERRDIGGQVDGALSVSTAVRVTHLPVAVVRLRRTKTNYSTGASKAGMVTSQSHVTVLEALNSNRCAHLFLIMRSSYRINILTHKTPLRTSSLNIEETSNKYHV